MIDEKQFDELTKVLAVLVQDLRFAADIIKDADLAQKMVGEGMDEYLVDQAAKISKILRLPITEENLTADEETLIKYYRGLGVRGRDAALDTLGLMAGFFEGRHAARREIEGDLLTFYNRLPEGTQFAIWDILGTLAGEWALQTS